MPAAAQSLNRLIIDVRLCFHRLKAVADDLHRDTGITTPMRAVLETLSDGGDWTVPQIARAKGVSRQHIQVTVDALHLAGLVEFRLNPAHRRSLLVAPTERGAAGFADMRQREKIVLAELAARLPPENIAIARDTLAALNDLLDERLAASSKGGQDD